MIKDIGRMYYLQALFSVLDIVHDHWLFSLFVKTYSYARDGLFQIIRKFHKDVAIIEGRNFVPEEVVSKLESGITIVILQHGEVELWKSAAPPGLVQVKITFSCNSCLIRK